MANTELVEQIDPEALIFKAIESNVPVETMERLLAMRKELKEERAYSEFMDALSGFQADCPIIKKTREVKNKTGQLRYRYAALEDIIKQVSPIMKANGLTYTISAEQEGDVITAKCTIYHRGGHSESSSFPVPIEKEAYMNDAQKSASANTFAKRYAFCNALGILTGDEDDDGKSLGDGVSPSDLYPRYRKMTDAILNNYESIMAVKNSLLEDNLDLAAEAYAEITKDDIMALWVAPTKGGPFTTEERTKLKSDEFGAILRKWINDNEGD